MAARPEALPLPRARPSGGAELAVGVSTVYLSLVVLLPLAALVWATKAHGSWQALSSSQAVAALKLTVFLPLAVAVFQAVAGTAVAWTLVPDRFWGQTRARKRPDRLRPPDPADDLYLVVRAVMSPVGSTGRSRRTRRRSPRVLTAPPPSRNQSGFVMSPVGSTGRFRRTRRRSPRILTAAPPSRRLSAPARRPDRGRGLRPNRAALPPRCRRW